MPAANALLFPDSLAYIQKPLRLLPQISAFRLAVPEFSVKFVP